MAGASNQTNRPSASVWASQSKSPLRKPFVAATAAPAIARPCESTTRPRSGLRGASVMTCGGISAATVIRRMAEAKPSACTVRITVGQFEAMKWPVWNRPWSSVFRGWNDPLSFDPVTTTVAPATGRPVGLSTVPATDAPRFIICTCDSARASSAHVRDGRSRNSRDA